MNAKKKGGKGVSLAIPQVSPHFEREQSPAFFKMINVNVML